MPAAVSGSRAIALKHFALVIDRPNVPAYRNPAAAGFSFNRETSIMVMTARPIVLSCPKNGTMDKGLKWGLFTLSCPFFGTHTS